MSSTANREFKCTYSGCNKSFSRRADLARHHLIHTNERPFLCTIPGCKRRFNQRTALTVHIRTHTGEKPFLCEAEGCNRAFADRSTYARHQRVHTQEKPYLCSIGQCYKRFTRRSVLIKHQQDCLHRRQTSSPRRSPPLLVPTDGPAELQSNLGRNTMISISPLSGNPNGPPALPIGLPFDALYNTAPPGPFLADISTIGNTGHSFIGASQPPLLGYGPYPQTCFFDWTLQNVSAATIPPLVPGQNFFPELRPEFMEALLPLAAETYPERLEELSNPGWGQVSRSIPSQEVYAENPANPVAVITD